MKIQLRFPEMTDLVELKIACLDPWALEWGFVHYFDSLLNRDCKKLISFLPPMAKGIGIDEGHVPCTFLFAFNDNQQVVGRVSIRHCLTADLKKFGGHIGFGVLPQYRNKGIASEILKQSLLICKNELFLNEVLVTCDDKNTGSVKTIEKNKGILIDKVHQEDSSILTRRYKIIT